ncbi:ciliary basal body-associated, B9 protein-domain-containing protein [Geranomyces variabilis]|nr:ciliary basal body-associated, B9 protein-domain-containing protein [Geranomyces variabilis]KAJ3138698.1 Pleiotropic negative transcriptional regulator [Geranomyces variabilis]
MADATQQSQHATTFYRTIDRVENFKIRIKLRKIADAKVPLNDEFSGLDEGAIALAKKRRRSLLPKPEATVISWGERIFSPSEILRHHNLQPGKGSPLAAKYHALLEQLIAQPNSEESRIIAAGTTKGARRQIFTLSDADAYAPQKPFTTSTREVLVPRQNPANAMRRPALLRKRNRVIGEEDIITSSPVPRTQKCGWEEMHIMAYLDVEPIGGSKENVSEQHYDEGVQICLCSIQAYDSGLVAITPGLNTGKKPHRVAIGPNVYEYTLKNASAPITEEDVESEWSIFQELYRQKRSALENILSMTFTSLPASKHVRFHITGQIYWAERFRSNTLYIRQCLMVPPEGWNVDEHTTPAQAMMSTTQVSRARNSQGVWRTTFGFPLEWVLVKLDKSKERPALYLTVCSVDSWNRHRLEGYGFLNIPEEEGRHDVTINTWRPLGSLMARVREYFIGGSTELEDLRYINPSSGNGQKVVSMHGLSVESSGAIRLTLDVMKQAEAFQVKPVTGKDSHAHFAKGDIKAISDALARARARVKALQANRKTE